MNPSALAPEPREPLPGYTISYSDGDYLKRTDPLTMLRLNDAVRTALRAYDEDCVFAARQAGASWEDIGQATGMARQNAQRKWSHLG